MTYSIVARDPETKELGIAVQTGTFGVGRGVPWAQAGVGAVATQSFTERSYGPLGLAFLRAGRSAGEALTGLVDADPDQRFRQVAIVDAEGRASAHTGSSCIRDCGHHVGDGYSVQANMMASANVWPAMAEAYEAATGPFTGRLLAALEAAERAGGDFRGAQSAALLVVAGEPSGNVWDGRMSDLRVDDSPDPVGELGRLLAMEDAYRSLRGPDPDREAKIAPVREKDRLFASAVDAAHAGDVERARDLLAPLFALDERWRDAVRASGERGDIPRWEDLLA